MARDVFVSYSQTDRECAFELVARLEAQGIGCWIAPRDITPSADWAAEIIDAISAARSMVLVFSAGTNDSPQVRREVERAVHKQLPILPFRIENVLPSKSLEYFLSTQHWMDAFTLPREAHYARLAAYLKAHLAAAPLAAADVIKNTAGAERAGLDPGGLDSIDLLHIERQLAIYIGPLAKHLVKKTALLAGGPEDLIARLMAELDTEPERRAFQRRCGQNPKRSN
jgi:hypothetical protein